MDLSRLWMHAPLHFTRDSLDRFYLSAALLENLFYWSHGNHIHAVVEECIVVCAPTRVNIAADSGRPWISIALLRSLSLNNHLTCYANARARLHCSNKSPLLYYWMCSWADVRSAPFIDAYNQQHSLLLMRIVKFYCARFSDADRKHRDLC